MASFFDKSKELLKNLKQGASNFTQYTLPQTAARVASSPILNKPANFVQQGTQRVQQSFQNPSTYWMPSAMQNLNTGIKPFDYTANRAGAYINNNYVASAKDVIPAFKQIQQPGIKNKIIGSGRVGLDVLGAIPDPTDILFGGYNYLKGVAQNKRLGITGKNAADNAIKAITLEKQVGLGDALTSNPTGQAIGNISELPILLMGGVLKGKMDSKKANQLLLATKEIDSLLNGVQDIPNMRPAGQMKMYNELNKALEKYLPNVAKSSEMKKLASSNVDEWVRKASRFLGSATQDAREKVLGYGFQARPLGGNDAIADAEKLKSQVSSTDDYLKELVNKQQKAGSSGTSQTIKAKTGGILADLKAKLVDETAPIQDLLSGAEKKGNFQVLPKNDVRLQIDRVLRSKNLASQFAEDNGLVDAIKKAPDINALDQYMIAKQAATVEKNGIKTGRDLVRDQQLIKDLSPQYEQIAQQVNQYSRKLLDYSVKTGLIDKNLATELVKKYPEYVPLNRVFNELEKATPRGTGKGVASLSKQTVVQRLEGSEREITSPIESLLLKTQDAFSQGERNIAAKQLASYKDLPGFEGVIKETKSGSLAPHTFSYINNGVKKTFATTPEIEAAAKSLNVEQMGLLGKILSTPTRVLQLGATGLNLPFVVTNMLKDEMTGFVNSNRAAKTSLLNPTNYVKSLFSALKHDDLYKEVVRNAAGGTSFDIARQAPNLSVEKLRNPKMYTVKHPLELLRAIENIVGRGEEVGRIKNYAGTKQTLLSEGRTAEDAMLLGAKAARENTANFARRGSWGRVLNWVIPFFNAGIQGARQLVGSFQARPAQTATKVAVTIFAPMAAVTAWNLSDPQRKQIYQDIPQYEKENNLVIIPENPTQDAKGRWNVIKVPLPPGLSNLASLVRRPMESAEGLDPVRFGEIANNLITAGTSIDLSSSNKLASTFTPQIAKPFVENVTNTNLFTGQKIVPEYLKNRLPEEQVKATTSEGARLIGKTLNISPLKVENFAQSQLGGLGSQLLGKESVAGNIERRFSKASSGALVDKIYSESDSFSALDARIKSLVETGKKEEARALITKNKQILLRGEIANDFKKQLSEYYTDRNKVLNSQTLTPEQKQKILLAIQKRITETSSMYSKVIAKQNL